MKELYILGNGEMAKAIAIGLRDIFDIHIVARSLSALHPLEKEGFKGLLYEDFDINDKSVILAFKPYALKSVARLLKGKARFIISVLAKTTLNELAIIPASNHAWVMPNIAAKLKASTTPFVLKNSEFKDQIVEILEGFGKAIELDDEAKMDAAGTLAGCSPAYLALIAEAMMNAGTYNGLKHELSSKLVEAAFASFTALLNEHTPPSLIRQRVCSPAGTTIKGVRELEKAGIRGVIYDCVSASVGGGNS